MTQFRVEPKTAKERTRVAEHGNIWELTNIQHIDSKTHHLLEAVGTRHLRWWPVDQCEPL